MVKNNKTKHDKQNQLKNVHLRIHVGELREFCRKYLGQQHGDVGQLAFLQ